MLKSIPTPKHDCCPREEPPEEACIGPLRYCANGVNTPYLRHRLLVYSRRVQNDLSSQLEKPASTRPPVPAAPSKQTADAFSPTRDVGDISSNESGYTLNIVGVYQDRMTRDWGLQTCRLAMQLLGEEHVQNNWYNVDFLENSVILLDAVRAALMADVVVVSVYAADELPLEIYAWIDLWLPRRLSRPGVLAALVGVADQSDTQSIHTREYLQTVAHKGQLDFIPQVRQRLIAASGSSDKLMMERPSTDVRLIQEPRGHRYEVQSHWGLNE
jgi:hypothetical protein